MSLIRTHALKYIFEPKTVAVIGASETPNSVGHSLMVNLRNSPFDGEVYPVNPKRSAVMGIPAVPRIKDLAEAVDLAIIATPADTVARIVQECVAADVKGVIIISAGFGETGRSGKKLEERVLAAARQSRMRLIGPNCLGVMNPYKGLNATFAPHMARPGNVGLISQSGAMLSAILDWSIRENAGFSKVISIGAMLDVNWSDMLHYLGDDPHTRSIVIYMESMGDPRGFLSAARDVARRKPIVLLKAGRNAQTAQAVASHVGAAPGDDLVMDAAFRRCGVLRVERAADLFYMAGVLSKQPRPKGSNLAIITNAGGPGILAADSLIDGGGTLAPLSQETVTKLNSILPAHWSHSNPIDLLAEATPEQYAQSLEIVAQDPETHGILVVLTPQDMTAPTRTAEAVKEKAATIKKPILTSWMGGVEVAAGEAILNQAEIPTMDYPDSAARIFNYMWHYARAIERLYETPVYVPELDETHHELDNIAAFITRAQTQNRNRLTEFESCTLLDAYGLQTRPTILASSADEAASAAQTIGFPVMVKLNSETLLDPVAVDGTWRNLTDVEAVRQAVRAIQATVRLNAGEAHFQGVTIQPQARNVGERFGGSRVAVGSHYDEQFGPVLRLGGSPYRGSESHHSGVLALPPLTSTLARHLIERTQRYHLLTAAQDKSIDREALEGALEQVLVRFSRLMVEQHRIRTIDIELLQVTNASGTPGSDPVTALMVVQAQIELHDAHLKETELIRSAIRPYPAQYAMPWAMRDGTPVVIRPIRPEDEPVMAAFNQTLSKDTIYLRYFYPVSVGQLTSHDRLAQFCFIDYDLEMTLVVEKAVEKRSAREDVLLQADGQESLGNDDNEQTIDSSRNEREIIAVGQLVRLHDQNAAEFALLVGDGYQQQGLGSELLHRLLAIAKDEGIEAVIGSVLPQNTGMRKICEKLGFTFGREAGSTALVARLEIE